LYELIDINLCLFSRNTKRKRKRKRRKKKRRGGSAAARGRLALDAIEAARAIPARSLLGD
jgi:hypothetical protein